MRFRIVQDSPKLFLDWVLRDLNSDFGPATPIVPRLDFRHVKFTGFSLAEAAVGCRIRRIRKSGKQRTHLISSDLWQQSPFAHHARFLVLSTCFNSKVAQGIGFISDPQPLRRRDHLLSWLRSPIFSSVPDDEYSSPHGYAGLA